MQGAEYPLNPEQPAERLSEEQVGEIRDHLTTKSERDLSSLLEFFDDPPSGAEAHERLQGTRFSDYPIEEIERSFALMAALLRAELDSRRGKPAA